MTNLPAVRGVAFKDRPDAVQVVSRGEAPSIITKMKRLRISEESIAEERSRYSTLRVLNPSEKAAVAAYQALEDGRVIIDLHSTLQNGHDISSRTSGQVLAFGHPSMSKVWMRRHQNSSGYDTSMEFFAHRPGKVVGRIMEPFYKLDFDNSGEDRWYDYVAAAPPVPQEIRALHPEMKSDKKYALLWEADWVLMDQHEPRAPIFDPALLYQISGTMYSVVAVWDLTPVEAAALRPGPKF